MRLERVPVDDEVVIDGETVVLVDGTVALLSRIAGRVLQLLAEGPRDAEEVRAQVVAEFGEPDDPGGAWRDLVAELVRRGLVRAVD